VTEEDITFAWLQHTEKPNTCLEVMVCCPEMMNLPVNMGRLINGKNSKPIFHQNHVCISKFEKEMAARREHNLFCYKSFQVNFEKEQKPAFITIKDGDLKWFDLLEGSYEDKKKNACNFKLLQLLIEEKDPKENQTGKATATLSSMPELNKLCPNWPSATMSSPQ
jgi:hypothetical protein